LVHTVATYDSPVRAMQAVAYLRSHNLHARASSISGSIVPVVTVYLNSQREANCARTILSKMPRDVPVTNLESQSLPDLSRLPAYLAPPCPNCKRPLPLDAAITACPHCSTPVDTPAIIVKYHGPEKLMQCYPDDHLAIESDMMPEISCPCGYDLHGLPRKGICPECGTKYEKPGLQDW